MEPFSAGNSIFNLLQVLDDWLRGEREHRVHRPGEAGNGRQRITDAPLPGLSVRGIGTIGLPLIDICDDICGASIISNASRVSSKHIPLPFPHPHPHAGRDVRPGVGATPCQEGRPGQLFPRRGARALQVHPAIPEEGQVSQLPLDRDGQDNLVILVLVVVSSFPVQTGETSRQSTAMWRARFPGSP